ncbi:MAG: TMEM143 family protein [Planctomycetota bacterium]|nr:TMEM143 family protein [Planctomycetota bacterium]
MSTREHYVPIRKADLIRRLVADQHLSPDQRKQFFQWCQILEATLHYEYHQSLEQLKNAYATFDPDATPDALNAAEPEKARDVDDLFAKVVLLLERANYRALPPEQIAQAVSVTSQWGVKLDVDLEAFQRLEIFTRGNFTAARQFRHWRNLFRRQEIQASTYRRLVVLFRLQQQSENAPTHSVPVYIKFFKDIPHADLETLLPCTKVQMTWLDRGRILLPAVSGAGLTIYKAIKGALVLAFAGIYGVLAFLGLVGGAVGYGVKSFLGYVRARDKYRLNLTQNLYFQNLDNNAGVLFRLLDEAEEQEFIEAALAYFLLWHQAPASGWTLDQLDRQAESYLRGVTATDVDFEVGDAVAKLLRMQIVEETADGTLTAVPIKNALQCLDVAWDNVFQHAREDSAIFLTPDESQSRAA